ncbi:hypothetical protein SAMN05444514_1564, partial [Pseudomonas syringae]
RQTLLAGAVFFGHARCSLRRKRVISPEISESYVPKYVPLIILLF